MTSAGPGPRTALEHLQQAAFEMIAAARATLDTLDGVIAQPPTPGAILGRFGPLAESLLEWLGSAGGSAATSPAGSDVPASDVRFPDATEPGRRKPVEHIPVR